MKKKTTLLFFALALAMILCSCASDQYYQSCAADKARDFLLERSPELTAEQVEFVRYNDPKLLVGDVLGDHSLGGFEKTSSIQRQICVTWEIPGRRELYMVMGVSADNMAYWHPQRMIKKIFYNVGTGQEPALFGSRRYISDNLYNELSSEELNKVLYLFPTVAETNFELNFNSDGTKNPKELERARKSVAKQKQFSLIWKSPDRNIITSGYGLDDMSGWKLLFAGIFSDKEMNEHIVRELNEPDNFYRPIDLSEPEDGKED